MKTQIIPKLTSILLALTLCLPFAACQDNASTDEKLDRPQDTFYTIDPSQTTEGAANITDGQVSDIELCWSCHEVPAAEGSIYCVNCKCLLCDDQRKPGFNYVYCGNHNCNESLCKNPAVESDDSQYCHAHKCVLSGCRNEKQQNSEYCYVHRDR